MYGTRAETDAGMPDVPNKPVASLLGEISARQEDMARRIGEVAGDAKAAREGVLEIKTSLEAQNLSQQIQDARHEARDDSAALRQDTVLAIGNLRTDMTAQHNTLAAAMKKLEDRVDSLEDDRATLTGAGKVADWIIKHMPWVAALLAAAAVGFGIKGNIH